MRVQLLSISCLGVLLAGCNNDLTTDCSAWLQWGNDAAHDGQSCIAGQALGSAVADVVIDPFVTQEIADTGGGDLVIHYQAPLLVGDDVYMMSKGGTYTPCDVVTTGSGSAAVTGPSCFLPDEEYRLNTEVWSESRFTWTGDGKLVPMWTFATDWKPEPEVGFEPMFQPALAGDLIAIPGAGGAVWELDRTSGKVVQHVQPFGDAAIDPDTYVAGGIAVAADGTLYYNALKLDHDAPYTMDAVDSWLVSVSPTGTATETDYAQLVPGAPAATDPCVGAFDFTTTPLPWPPAPQLDGSPTLPASAPCGSQRPGMNAAPALGADGTIFLATRAHLNERYSFLVALNPDLTPRWAKSMRDQLHDGCGVLVPSDGTASSNFLDCRAGTSQGVDPNTNELPAAGVDDDSSASPVALPDGGVLYGAFTGYNGFRGHLMHFDAAGAFVTAYDFGWDSSPAIVPLGGDDYDIVIKDNHYGEDENGVDLGPYYITRLSKGFAVRWRFQSTNTKSCVRDGSGDISCVEDHPHGFEWCINAPAVDKDGIVYANSEDGTAYAIAPNGTLRDEYFLDAALGAAYTPVTLDHMGRVFALNSGHMIAVGAK